jgi:hypothetical protein
MARGPVLLVGFDSIDPPVLDQLRGAVDLVTVSSVDEALDAMLRRRPSVVILNRAFDTVKPNALARSLRGLVTEDVIVLHVGALDDDSSRREIDAHLSHPLRLTEVLDVVDRVRRDGGRDIRVTTRMVRLRD